MKKILTNWKRIQLAATLGIIICFLIAVLLINITEIKSASDIMDMSSVVINIMLILDFVLYVYKKAVPKNQDIAYKDPIDNRIYRGTLSSMILALLCLLISGFFSDSMVQIIERCFIVYVIILGSAIIWDIRRWINESKRVTSRRI